MTDLVCVNCGASFTYADAQIADMYRSCDGEKHDFVERLHDDIDVVTG